MVDGRHRQGTGGYPGDDEQTRMMPPRGTEGGHPHQEQDYAHPDYAHPEQPGYEAHLPEWEQQPPQPMEINLHDMRQEPVVDPNEVDRAVAARANETTRTVAAVLEYTFFNPATSTVREPEITEGKKQAFVEKIPHPEWRELVTQSMLTVTDDKREKNRLVSAVTEKLTAEQHISAESELACVQWRRRTGDCVTEIEALRTRRESLEADLEQTRGTVEEQENLIRKLWWGVGIAVVALLAALVWVWAVKTSGPDIDEDMLSEDPQVAQLQTALAGKDEELAQAKADLDKANGELKDARDEAKKAREDAKRSAGSSGGALESKQKEIDSLNSKVSDLQEKVSEKDREVQQKQARIDALEDRVDDLRSRPAQQPAPAPAPTVTQTVTVQPDAPAEG